MRFSLCGSIGKTRAVNRLPPLHSRRPGSSLASLQVLVDLARPLLLDDVALDELVADPHAEAADRRVGRQREAEHAFEPFAWWG